MAFTAIDAVSRSNTYSGSRQQTEGGGVAFTAIDAVSRSNTYSGSRQQTEGANWGGGGGPNTQVHSRSHAHTKITQDVGNTFSKKNW